MLHRHFPIFYVLFTLHRRPRFNSDSPVSQPCLATIFKPKRKLFASHRRVVFQSEMITILSSIRYILTIGLLAEFQKKTASRSIKCQTMCAFLFH